MKVRRSLLKGTVSAETYSGDSAYGPVYATAATVRCHIENVKRKLGAATKTHAVVIAMLRNEISIRDMLNDKVTAPTPAAGETVA